MKPWRETIAPHPDVLEGTFQQSEFAADISAVKNGKATREYQDATAFYERTFITEGMRLLLLSVAKRLNGQGGDPVIQLQTAFGGGKTHTMLAVYHLATRPGSLQDLPGVPAILDEAKLLDVPTARVAVLDGTQFSPGQAWKHGKKTIHTLWGELAWQLGGEDGYALIAEADTTGTSPGNTAMEELLRTHGPCVILVDELVAYIRQFTGDERISGGTYDSNLSFIQSLTQAIKLVPNAIMLASLPESDVEAGSGKGVTALRALEKYFGRVQALWKTVSVEESFEIVRRRLFETVKDEANRDAVCRAFAATYVAEGTKFPVETQEAKYQQRLTQAYPIHPEIFDRLFEDWSTIDGFQRTRGVLKLMAKVIYRLWKDQNADLLILPSSLPLYDGETRNELTYHLQPGWDAVLQKDIDGERAETTEMETKDARFGAVQAARRVARTLFFGTAPASVSTRQSLARGLERSRVLLGCMQPGQTASLFSDVLNRLVDRLHYLNTSGEKSQETTRFWFDTRANLRREMEERKRRFHDTQEVLPKIVETLQRLTKGCALFDGVHVVTSTGDIPDDTGLRLVVLDPTRYYSKVEDRLAFEAVREVLKNHGNQPRYRQNRLLFLAADADAVTRLREAIRSSLAWKSILDDVGNGKLNIDRVQEEQAKKEAKAVDDAMPRTARECYKWLLCPGSNDPGLREATIEAFQVNTAGDELVTELTRICTDNELVISRWSAMHLRSLLKQYYWKADKPAAGAQTVWQDTLKYLYLPRLRSHAVFEQAIQQGVASEDFFGTALGEKEGRYEGFRLGVTHVQVDDSLLLLEPGVAKAYRASLAPTPVVQEAATTQVELGGLLSAAQTASQPGSAPVVYSATTPGAPVSPVAPSSPKMKSFHGTVEVNAATARARLLQIAEEVISQLVSDPMAKVTVNVEISAEFPQGAAEQVRRAVSENATNLKFKVSEWEK
jgi:predicted AAA+ superfamily ATPase